jgi:hypothetical protein
MDMKKRTNGQSPDAADAFAIMCDVYVSQVGFGNATGSQEQNSSAWDEFFLDNTLEENYS